MYEQKSNTDVLYDKEMMMMTVDEFKKAYEEMMATFDMKNGAAEFRDRFCEKHDIGISNYYTLRNQIENIVIPPRASQSVIARRKSKNNDVSLHVVDCMIDMLTLVKNVIQKNQDNNE